MKRTCLPLSFFALSSLLGSCATTQIHYLDAGAATDLKEPRSVAIGRVLTTDEVRFPEREEATDIGYAIHRQLDRKRKKLSVSTQALFEAIVGRPLIARNLLFQPCGSVTAHFPRLDGVQWGYPVGFWERSVETVERCRLTRFYAEWTGVRKTKEFLTVPLQKN